MRRFLSLLFFATLAFPALGQSDLNPALNSPDEVSWRLFTLVMKPVATTNPAAGTSNVLFETWASNEDTFRQNPVFPGAATAPSCDPNVPVPVTPFPSPKILNIPALFALQPQIPGLEPHVLPRGRQETRRNQVAFDFIVCNTLYSRTGLRAAFAAGKQIVFPIASVEVKADWVPLETLDPADYYVNTATDGKTYALVSFHIISKMIPNWTWATFEHRDNIGRCDFTGCRDKFGALVQDVEAHQSPGNFYDPCTKTDALKEMFADAGIPSLWENYCLKGTQVDFVTPTGVPTLLGNSVTEAGFNDTSSCITCHARADITATGRSTTQAGFLDAASNPALCPSGPNAPCSPNGSPLPFWFLANAGQPNETTISMQTDFVWSIPFKAIP